MEKKSKISLQDRLSYASKRIKDEKSKLMKFKNFSIRDEEAFHKTAYGITTAIKNSQYASDGLSYNLDEALFEGMKNISTSNANFSESDLGSVEDMQVVDITLATITSSSALNFLAVDTAMESLVTNVTFQSLVAANSAAGVNKDDVVVDARQALNPMINIGKSGAVGTFAGALANGTLVVGDTPRPILSGETKIYVDYGMDTEQLVGFALKKGPNYGSDAEVLKNTKDEIVFKVVPSGVTIADEGAFIDVTTGAVTGITANAGTVTVVFCWDRTGEIDGRNTLRLKVKNSNIIMKAERNRLHLENSIENIVEMNKIYANNAEMGIGVDYGKRAFQQLAVINKFFYDTQIVRTLWDGAKGLKTEETIDLSEYPMDDFRSFSPTKDNFLQKGMMSLAQKFLYRTGRGVTAWVVDSISALMLGNSANFVKSDAFMTRRDGLIGTYDNIPVLRYAYLDAVRESGSSISGEGKGTGVVLGVFKDISGKAAPVAWGSYLQPYSTIPALNPANPSQITSALYSMTACTLITDAWIIKGEIKAY